MSNTNIDKKWATLALLHTRLDHLMMRRENETPIVININEQATPAVLDIARALSETGHVVNVGTPGHTDYCEPNEFIICNYGIDVPPEPFVIDNIQHHVKRGKKGKVKKDWQK